MNKPVKSLLALLGLVSVFLLFPPSQVFSTDLDQTPVVTTASVNPGLSDYVLVERDRLSAEQLSAAATISTNNGVEMTASTNRFERANPPLGKVAMLLFGMLASIAIAWYSYRQLSE